MNLTIIVDFGLILTGIYLGLGFLFALWLVTGRMRKIDPVAAGGRWGFRLLVLPGITALWPVFAIRLAKGRNAPPVEKSPHRAAAGGAS